MPEQVRERRDALPMQTRLAPVSSVDAEARTVALVWTTGASVRRRRFDWDTMRTVNYDEVLIVSDKAVDLSRLNAGAAVLDSHNAYTTQAQVAVVERAAIRDGEGVATIRFPKQGLDESSDRLFALVADRIVRNISVGYAIDKVRIEKSETAGEVEKWFVERWTPYELSFVTIGADPGAQVRTEQPDRLFPFEVTNRVKPDNQENHAMSKTNDVPGNAPAEDKPNDAARTADVPAPAPETVNAEQVRAQEQERITTITSLVEQFKLERAVADDLVKRNVSVADARKVILDKLAERDARGIGHSQVSMPAGGLDATVTRREAIAEAILHRAQPQAFAMTDRSREYRGMRLIDVARDCLEAAGVRTRGMTPNEIAYQATRAAGLQSTSDFPLILAAVAGKRLRQAYAGTPRTFQTWARGTTATDFKPMYPTQIGSFPALKAVMEGAEFSYGSIAEGRESYQLATYGRIVALTRQAIINDDLRAFDRALGTAGQRAADLESGIVYNVLLANASSRRCRGPLPRQPRQRRHRRGDRRNLTVGGLGEDDPAAGPRRWRWRGQAVYRRAPALHPRPAGPAHDRGAQDDRGDHADEGLRRECLHRIAANRRGASPVQDRRSAALVSRRRSEPRRYGRIRPPRRANRTVHRSACRLRGRWRRDQGAARLRRQGARLPRPVLQRGLQPGVTAH